MLCYPVHSLYRQGCEEVTTETLESGAMIYLQKGGNPRSRFTELEHKIREACGRYPAEGLVQEKWLQ